MRSSRLATRNGVSRSHVRSAQRWLHCTPWGRAMETLGHVVCWSGLLATYASLSASSGTSTPALRTTSCGSQVEGACQEAVAAGSSVPDNEAAMGESTITLQHDIRSCNITPAARASSYGSQAELCHSAMTANGSSAARVNSYGSQTELCQSAEVTKSSSAVTAAGSGEAPTPPTSAFELAGPSKVPDGRCYALQREPPRPTGPDASPSSPFHASMPSSPDKGSVSYPAVPPLPIYPRPETPSISKEAVGKPPRAVPPPPPPAAPPTFSFAASTPPQDKCKHSLEAPTSSSTMTPGDFGSGFGSGFSAPRDDHPASHEYADECLRSSGMWTSCKLLEVTADGSVIVATDGGSRHRRIPPELLATDFRRGGRKQPHEDPRMQLSREPSSGSTIPRIPSNGNPLPRMPSNSSGMPSFPSGGSGIEEVSQLPLAASHHRVDAPAAKVVPPGGKRWRPSSFIGGLQRSLSSRVSGSGAAN